MNRLTRPRVQAADPAGRYSVYTIGQLHGCEVNAVASGGRLRLVATIDRRGTLDLDLQHWPNARGTAGVRYVELAVSGPGNRGGGTEPLPVSSLGSLVAALNKAIATEPLEQVVVTLADPRVTDVVRTHGSNLVGRLTEFVLCLINDRRPAPVGIALRDRPPEIVRFTALARGRAYLT